MCIMAMAWNAHPRWRLILIGNRDELHARPAAPLARWDRPGHLVAGRDLLSGGTWMGVSEQGRAAIVTNLRGYGDPRPDRASRGALVTDLLAGRETAALDDFNPFNLISIEGERAHFLTNRPTPLRTELAPGLYGLSNGALDAPWPKTLALKSALLDWLVAGAANPLTLFGALRSESLPQTGIAPDTPSDVPAEALISPIFIRDPVYGTRCGTIIAIDAQGQGTITERRFDADGTQTGESSIPFAWPMAGGAPPPLP
ncbi:NRDE family protein [Sphingobium sp. JS3065]|uniref:NRDE family protein n=1 Tax=Sphingobium sp. JS3065 TaxID=2970925 RepID=UPI0022641704|nr:NRDE family protein [Sphingobium sp. JS3065]UZW55497.1 NRDE family protein [Sphingobium sp. JS3065]